MQIGDFELYLFAAGGWRNDRYLRENVPTPVFTDALIAHHFRPLDIPPLENSFYTVWVHVQ